jgi:hypothetical protein
MAGGGRKGPAGFRTALFAVRATLRPAGCPSDRAPAGAWRRNPGGTLAANQAFEGMDDDRTNFNTTPAIFVLLGIVFVPIALIHLIALILEHS